VKRAVALGALAALVAAVACSGATTSGDWGRFGYDAARHSSSPDAAITAKNAAKLVRRRVQLDGTVDSSPIFVGGKLVVTTTYGRTEALSPATGKAIWRFTPPSYSQLAGSAQITNATPVASADGSAVYAAAPDGRIRKLRLSDGKVLWTTRITRDPTHEKITSSLNLARGLVIATTGGYIGDAPPYQGHVVTMSERTGRIAHVWNSLCSDRRTVILPRTCGSSDSAIWSRSGAAVDPANGTLVIATGNGPWNGRTDWGDSVIVLSPDASRMLRHWTPANQAQLESSDADLGSTSPALFAGGYAIQGGKDGKLRLLQLHRLPGVNAQTGV
jgi:outer membrane protein assembly factor BamB